MRAPSTPVLTAGSLASTSAGRPRPRACRRPWLLVLAISGLAAGACRDGPNPTDTTTTTPTTAKQVRRITISPDAASLEPGQTAQLEAVVTADSGVPHDLTWRTTDSAVARVSAAGLVTAVATGKAQITATSVATPGVSASATVAVASRRVAAVVVTPKDTTVGAGAPLQLAAVARDAAGDPVLGGHVVWQSRTPAVATVDSTGLVRGVAAGTATILARVYGVSDSASVRVTAAPLRFQQLVVGGAHTCGLSVAGRTYCWGDNQVFGMLGRGDVDGTADRPTPIVDDPAFVRLAAGYDHTCGLTAAGDTYCWGYNRSGQLGVGGSTATDHPRPTRLAGSPPFVEITAGHSHTCGRTAAGGVHCWGANLNGALGTGRAGHESVPPATPVAGAYTHVAAGYQTTCGLRAGGVAYCWGHNVPVQDGDAVRLVDAATPTLVTGPENHDFVELAVGMTFACGRRLDGATYCWGSATGWTLADGTENVIGRPLRRGAALPVLGAPYAAITAGFDFACAVQRGTAAGLCWGSNANGVLGTGGDDSHPRPTPVHGGLRFARVVTHEHHTCGWTTAGDAYCWGDNFYGQLGTGTRQDAKAPVPVIAEP